MVYVTGNGSVSGLKAARPEYEFPVGAIPRSSGCLVHFALWDLPEWCARDLRSSWLASLIVLFY